MLSAISAVLLDAKAGCERDLGYGQYDAKGFAADVDVLFMDRPQIVFAG